MESYLIGSPGRDTEALIIAVSLCGKGDLSTTKIILGSFEYEAVPRRFTMRVVAWERSSNTEPSPPGCHLTGADPINYRIGSGFCLLHLAETHHPISSEHRCIPTRIVSTVTRESAPEHGPPIPGRGECHHGEPMSSGNRWQPWCAPRWMIRSHIPISVSLSGSAVGNDHNIDVGRR